MDIRSKDGIRNVIITDLWSIHNRYKEMSKRLNENVEDNLEYLRALFAQLSQPTSTPFVTKTPRISRKRGLQRIETIPENGIFQQEENETGSTQSINEEEKETNELVGRRSKRVASQRAVDNIRKQNSLMLNMKLRRPTNESDSLSAKKNKIESQIKRKKSKSSSDEDDDRRGSKYSKLDKDILNKTELAREMTCKESEQIVQSNEEIAEKIQKNLSPKLRRSTTRSGSKKSQGGEVKKVDDAIIAPTTDDVDEPSMYEDAIGKPTPIMNSTLKCNSILPEKMLNATVVLESLPQQRKLNETVVIQKESSQQNRETTESISSEKALRDSMQLYKEANNMYNGLITDDESSPEEKRLKKQITKKQDAKKQGKCVISSDDEEVPNTPVGKHFREAKASAVIQEIKTTYKSNALFSPYAKESVKKRVEAFEQAVMHSPKSVDVDAPTRVTRTKTRAMAAAEASVETQNTDKNVAQVLARKSLARAKKTAYLKEKQRKELEELEAKISMKKEQMPERINKLLLNDKINTKLMPQLKITPLSKTKTLPSISANRLHTPLNTQNISNYSKALTASRANIITGMDSFIQATKTVSKTNSVEKLEDKGRYEEDARKKKEEALRLQMEEKRRKRQQKELKNKMAREAKEKQELEKRQKAEREREEKARLAQQMQEKQREEAEKKRVAQLQRAQEKEERRKLEEQQRLQRLQEQEETERLLAEQRRREQEAEKRKEADARVQQQAAAEAQKQKNQMLAAQAKYKQANNKPQGTTNYVLDSEPDDDDSDDESRPKHEIPNWAQVHVRKTQLAMQRYISEEIIYKFFDTRKCTPDLTELFHGIDRNRLKRTSSAIWKTPPRFSMME